MEVERRRNFYIASDNVTSETRVTVPRLDFQPDEIIVNNIYAPNSGNTLYFVRCLALTDDNLGIISPKSFNPIVHRCRPLTTPPTITVQIRNINGALATPGGEFMISMTAIKYKK